MNTAPNTEEDPKHVPVNNASAPLRPAHHQGVTLAQLALLAGAPAAALQGPAAQTVASGVSLDSRSILPGDLYLALPGAKAHGAQFAGAAVAAGAVAILTDDAGTRLLGESAAVPVLTVADPRAVTGAVAAAIYGTASLSTAGTGSLDLFAVTGTNGKTTTTYFLNSLLRALGTTTGLIGTIEILAGEQPIPSKLTTPESTDVHALLAVMAEKGLGAASMEVSSHALAFGRVDAVKFNVAGFTNLTQDHLDLHGSMEEYFDTKATLFTHAHSENAVITVDDRWGRLMAQRAGAPTVTLSTRAANLGDEQDADAADWQVRNVRREGIGSRFTLQGPHAARLEARTGLPGDFNVSNAALALTMVATHLLTKGREGASAVGHQEAEHQEAEHQEAERQRAVLARLQDVLDRLDPFTVEVPGRMQLVGTAPVAVVDFAHNPDALERALDAVRPVAPGARLIAVFGATGERDATKRPIMGAVVARGADVVIITDDDPHDEDPATIRADVFAGAAAVNEQERLGRTIEEVGLRAEAIARAVELATAEDVILVAGRGHEVFQEVKGINISLDDRAELRAALAARRFPLTHASTIESTTND